jgi:hypothetical protein
MGDEMIETRRRTTDRTRLAPALLLAGFFLLVSAAAGAAERVVLGEYFTNTF